MASNWINDKNAINKNYAFEYNHATYKVFKDSLYHIVSNTSNENKSKKGAMIVTVNQKGDLVKTTKLSDTNNFIISGTKLKEGGFLFVGYNKLNNDDWNKIYVAKTDKNLNIIWTNNYGSDNYENKGYAIIQVNEKEYWILGHTKASTNNTLLLKIDDKGKEKWFSYLPNLNCSFASHMIINKSKEVIIAGQNSKQLFVAKINSNGNIDWSYNYTEDNYIHRLYEIKNTNDGIIIVGNTMKNLKNKKDILIIKLSTNGKEEWVKVLGNQYSEAAYDIENTKNGNYIISGFALKDKEGTLYSSFIIKTDQLGNELSRVDLNKLNSNKIYDIDVIYNEKIKNNSFIAIGDIINEDKTEILFMQFNELVNFH
tara:strand:+ start:1177 stop:2283 length:1107 start_codon:yes stop_codon:yes gene_type:complete